MILTPHKDFSFVIMKFILRQLWAFVTSQYSKSCPIIHRQVSMADKMSMYEKLECVSLWGLYMWFCPWMDLCRNTKWKQPTTEPLRVQVSPCPSVTCFTVYENAFMFVSKPCLNSYVVLFDVLLGIKPIYSMMIDRYDNLHQVQEHTWQSRH